MSLLPQGSLLRIPSNALVMMSVLGAKRGFPSGGGDWGHSPYHNLSPPSQPCPPQNFLEYDRENNSLLLKIPPTSQLPRENPGQRNRNL